MRIWILLISCLIICTQAISQGQRYEDVIYLKNGSIIRGEIIEQTVGESVKILLLGGSILVYQQSDIEVIKQEPSIYREAIRLRNRRFRRPHFHERGMSYGIGLQFLSHGPSWDWRLDPALAIRAGYRFQPKLEAGISTGFHMYSSGFVVPIQLYAKGQQANRKVALGYLAEAGWGTFGFANQRLATKFTSQQSGQIGGGLVFHSTKKREWWALVTYKFQKTYLRQEWPDQFGREPTISERRTLHQGINFQLELSF